VRPAGVLRLCGRARVVRAMRKDGAGRKGIAMARPNLTGTL